MSAPQTLAIIDSVQAGLMALPPPADPQVLETGRRLRRILVATDGTPASDSALATASQLARDHGAKLDVVSVLIRWGPPVPGPELLDMTSDLLADRLARVLFQSSRLIAPGIPWTIRIVDGGLVPGIVDTARELESDLIVSGQRRRWIDRYLRRPTSVKLARHTDVPVLAVPHVDASRRNEGRDDADSMRHATNRARPRVSATRPAAHA
jgi:nucleotide-binding universal stress UspA family protein